MYERRTRKQFLIDSGSDLSIIPARKNEKKDVLPYFAKAANGTDIHMFGEKFLEIDFGLEKTFRWKFILGDTVIPIIGADFLSHYDLLPDLKRKRLVNGITLTSSRGSLQNATQHSISVVTDIQCSDTNIQNALRDFPELLKPTPFVSTPPHNVVHYITTNGTPVHQKVRRLRPQIFDMVRRELDCMTKMGICRPSNSPWASPMLLREKTGGQGLRVCGDYRSVNQQTVPDRYPIAHLQDSVQRLDGATIFSHIDLVRAFHNIPVHEPDVPKTAIITPFGLYEFLRMPFGLRNAP